MKSYKNNYKEPIELQIYKLVIDFAKRYRIQLKRDMTNEEMEEWVSCAAITIIEALDTFDPSKGTLATFVSNYCLHQESVFYLQAKYNFSKSQARNMLQQSIKKRSDNVDNMYRVWSPYSVNTKYKDFRESTNEDCCNIYDIVPDEDVVDPIEKITIDSMFEDMETCIKNMRVSKNTKELLLWWMNNGFNELDTVKHFNVSKQWVNYNVNKLRDILRKKWKIRRVS